jgi:hypothetical protein
MPDVEVLLDKLNKVTGERNEAVAARDKAVEVAKMLIARVHGDTGRCKGCLKEIYWVRHREGAITPYNKDGTMHHSTCPHANQFTRGPRQASLYEGGR